MTTTPTTPAMSAERLDYLRAASDDIPHSGIVIECVVEIDRLSAALKEAERERDVWAKDRWGALEIWKSRALAAESALATARRELLDWLLAIAGGRRASIGSMDNTYCPQLSRERVDEAIRALQLQQKDTAP